MKFTKLIIIFSLLFLFISLPFFSGKKFFHLSSFAQEYYTDTYYNPEKSVIWEHPALLKVYVDDNSDKTYLVKRAFYMWNNDINLFNYYFVNDEERADIVCKFIHKIGSTVAGRTHREVKMLPDGKVAFKKATITIAYGDDYRRFYNNHQYFLTVILHEIGHALGIAYHSNSTDDIMYPYVDAIKNYGQLSQRDINTLKQIYGLNKV